MFRDWNSRTDWPPRDINGSPESRNIFLCGYEFTDHDQTNVFKNSKCRLLTDLAKVRTIHDRVRIFLYGRHILPHFSRSILYLFFTFWQIFTISPHMFSFHHSAPFLHNSGKEAVFLKFSFPSFCICPSLSFCPCPHNLRDFDESVIACAFLLLPRNLSKCSPSICNKFAYTCEADESMFRGEAGEGCVSSCSDACPLPSAFSVFPFHWGGGVVATPSSVFAPDFLHLFFDKRC